MIDAEFVLAAYGVIFGGLGIYALALARRLRTARRRAGLDDDGEGR